ncbi:MAG: undecaprenyldiphospho-muramoylpentapeptide beta-N-acetylglucosaminyltransferase [Clostridiales bacterium]|jgi:UDP-N-acetylglucosamine--N-acetylmuramyl-(pentapeptide) pyrophosphoryl-undecaprenol N-acetylglucosamine transferase|nr:undecaprenyldiphospho-muramoylpentapeptide beta-N-acetylglucosaminyltransferase [Clostridiales bacterium]
MARKKQNTQQAPRAAPAGEGASYAGASAGGARRAIVLTGGGTAGHVLPNLTLLPKLLAAGWDVHYIGTKKGGEAALMPKEGITYHAIQTGKFRRYFAAENFVDPFKVACGVAQAFAVLSRVKPSVVFSKGGFVGVPVILAAKLRRIPSVVHESDITPGLANRICAPLASAICTSFRQTAGHLAPSSRAKCRCTGAPVRPELLAGDRGEGYRLCGFSGEKPVLLVCGGSTGSQSINRLVRSTLGELLKTFDVAHLCGRGNAASELSGLEGYAQFEYAGSELPHIYSIASLAVSRAGASSIFELLSLRIPSVLIPLPLSVSRGDQIRNAEEFEGRGYCVKLEEEQIASGGVLLGAIQALYGDRARYAAAMEAAESGDAAAEILATLEAVAAR